VLEQKGADCKLKGGPAKRCLNSMELLTCPADGDLDAALPPDCANVWHKCLGGDEIDEGNLEDSG
jgi:hypothetical protein